jgi:hypothetical protein
VTDNHIGQERQKEARKERTVKREREKRWEGALTLGETGGNHQHLQYPGLSDRHGLVSSVCALGAILLEKAAIRV